MSKKGLPWFRLYAEAIDDEKLRLLAFEDRWHYVALLCCKSAGLLDAGDSEPMLHRKIAVKLGLQLRELEAVALRLAEVGLIDGGTFQPLAWDERQFKSDSSTERVKAFREKMKHGSNVSVTAQDTDTEADTKKKAKAGAASRGTRLPADWEPDAEDKAYADAQRVDWRIEAEGFKDWWAAAAGAKGVKLDWHATWRTWVRRAPKSGPASAAAPRASKPKPAETPLEAALAHARYMRDVGGLDDTAYEAECQRVTAKYRSQAEARA